MKPSIWKVNRQAIINLWLAEKLEENVAAPEPSLGDSAAPSSRLALSPCAQEVHRLP